MEGYFHFGPVAASLGMFYAHPDGTQDGAGSRFWNATPACCNFYSSSVDDSAYLAGVIREIQEAVSIDPDRIFVFGHSNGGFMSHRLACDHADTIAAIASIAGATFLDPADCTPVAAVHVLEIHGTADETIHYPGGTVGEFIGYPAWPRYPGAVATVEQWAAHNGCSLELEYGQRLDLNAGLPGSETSVTRYAAGCAVGGSSELWTVQNGTHGPVSVANFAEILANWFLKHPKGLATRATFTLTPASGACPLDVAADASGSTAVAGTAVVSYQWDFGDGATGEGTVATHTYMEPGRHIVTLTTTTDAGQFDTVIRPVSVSCPPGDISPWTAASLGEPSIAGSAWLEAPGGIESLHICAGGTVFSGTRDEGFLAYQELSGDFAIAAKISDVSASAWGASVGLMFRESLSPVDRFAAVLLTISPAVDRVGSLCYRIRRRGGQSAACRGVESVASLPVWLKVERSGEVFRGWRSLDGESWSLIHEDTLDGLPETLLGGVAAAGRDSLSQDEAYVPLQAVVSELTAVPSPRFRRGDANADSHIDIADAMRTLYSLFGHEEVSCLDAGDANDSGEIDIGDAISILSHLFVHTGPLLAPFDSCGYDPTGDDLNCTGFPPCD